MNSSYGKSTNKTDAFDFDLGLGSARSKPLNGQKTQTPQQRPANTTSSPWAHQPTKPSWTHQPAAPNQPIGPGSLSGPTSMVGDIFGKSWNSSSSSGIGIVNNKNPNLFGDLLGSAMGPNNKSSSNNNVPLKNAAGPNGPNTFRMGGVADSLPKTGNFGSNVGGNVSFGGNVSKSSNLGGGPSMKTNKDPFGSLFDLGTKPSSGMNSSSKTSAKTDSNKTASKTSGSSFSSSAFPSSKTDPMGGFGFSDNVSTDQSEPLKQTYGGNDFDALFTSTERFTSQQVVEDDDWGVNSEFGGGSNDTTTELEGLPPPPAGVSAPAAKSKGMESYRQGQFADAIKWLSWAVVLLEKNGDGDGAREVLTSRASCYKEVGEYKKAVADCTKVLERDGKNVAVLVQRALLYEQMEKYKLGAEDLRTVMKFDPGNRVARSTIHRLTKMAE